MAGRVRLIGHGDGVEAAVHSPVDKTHLVKPGLVVYTHSLEVGVPIIKFFTDTDGNVNQNVNATGAGTLTVVHNGTDTVAWTAAATIGTWDFASTAQAHTGTKSIDATGTRNGDIATFSTTSLTLTAQESLRGYIYITSWPSSGNKDIEFALESGGATVGSPKSLKPYIDTSLQNQWQVFEIPVTDFGATVSTIDAIKILVVDSGQGSAPKAYFDDIAFVGAGGGTFIQYEIAPPANETWVINRIKWTAVSGGQALKYNEFFGISELANGYSFGFSSGLGVRQTFTAKNFFQMAQYPNVTLNAITATSTLFEVTFDIPFEQQTLIGGLGQRMVLTVRDDLSSLTEFRAAAQGYIRTEV